jgi:hypothetical protein
MSSIIGQLDDGDPQLVVDRAFDAVDEDLGDRLPLSWM